jgi:hypothetical protein
MRITAIRTQTPRRLTVEANGAAVVVDPNEVVGVSFPITLHSDLEQIQLHVLVDGYWGGYTLKLEARGLSRE